MLIEIQACDIWVQVLKRSGEVEKCLFIPLSFGIVLFWHVGVIAASELLKGGNCGENWQLLTPSALHLKQRRHIEYSPLNSI